MTTKIYSPYSEQPLNAKQLADWANKVHRQSGGKGSPFSRWDYYEDIAAESRLAGALCNCGADERGFSKGEFVLSPLSSEEVKDGGKAYMRCRNCGCWSHL